MGHVWDSAPLDGAVYAEPLVDGSNVIVATENNSLYSFDAGSGALRWAKNLGTPRTQNFPCGDINPLGITGTPVIDGGFLYALAEVQTSPTTFEFHLAKVDPSSGAVSYNKNVTPSGMDPNVQQERSALAVSGSNVVIAWGGLDGDCGSYHGFLETVSESTGTAVHQWNDTAGGREGGMWATGGAAVDGAGNIFVATGNGSSTNLSNYDYGDSVLKFNSALALQSFFAPGTPQSWTSLNANDTDLGSVDPVLLANGTLFEIGKGGRGYLLNQSSLPNNSNPGGGENYSAQVCSTTSDAAFGGMAAYGNLVLVPCRDGIAAVSIDATNAFHRAWYQTSGGGGSPIVASGLVWTVPVFGGSTLYGLDIATGAIAQALALPASTEHFVTPVAGDGHLYVAAANRLAAFAPPFAPGSAQPPAAAADSSGNQDVVWKGADGGLWEARWSGSWSGPFALRMGQLGSPPAIAIRPSGEADVVWEGADANLWEASDVGGTWTGPVRLGMGPLGSAPTVAAWGSELDVFWEGADGQLWEAWETATTWHGPARIGMGPLGSQPTAGAHSNGEQDVFWEGADRQLWEAAWNGAAWVGPQKIGMGPLGSQPTVGVLASGEQDVLWLGGDDNIWMTAWSGAAWIGPSRVGMGPLGSAPAAAAWGTEVDAFWQGTDRNLWGAKRPNGAAWTGPTFIGMGPLG
jgi:hypothetical protein